MDSDSRRGDAARARSTRGAKRGALAALVGALAASRIARASSQGVETPPLNAHVSARARVASAGMDPNIEATAAAWFARSRVPRPRGRDGDDAGRVGRDGARERRAVRDVVLPGREHEHERAGGLRFRRVVAGVERDRGRHERSRRL